jgi:hypothetical protein
MNLANPARLHAESFGAIVLKNSSVKVAGPARLKNLFGPVCLPVRRESLVEALVSFFKQFVRILL